MSLKTDIMRESQTPIGVSKMSSELYFNKESEEVRILCERDELLSYAVNFIGEIRYNLDRDTFKCFIDTIIGQMLSNKVGDVISNRLENLCFGIVSPETVASLDISDLRGIGLSKAKSEYILSFAKMICENPNFFEELKKQPEEEIKKELLAIKGIGIWSADMYLLFGLGRPDILPTEDGAFAQAVKWLYGYEDKTRERKSLKILLGHWSPYSSIAARYMYKILDSGVTKTNRDDFVKAKGYIQFSR